MRCVTFSTLPALWRLRGRKPVSAAAERLNGASVNGSNSVPPSEDSSPPEGQTFRQAFEALVTTLNTRGIRYAIIGGVAMIQHTRIRTTDDIDALMTVPQISLPGLFEALQQRGFEVNLQTQLRELRDDGLTSIRYKDVIVDLMLPIVPAYAHILDRAIRATVLGQETSISSAEGLIIMKLMAMRPQDETDIRELLATYGSQLDLDFIRSELATFTDSTDPRRSQFEAWLRESQAQQ